MFYLYLKIKQQTEATRADLVFKVSGQNILLYK